MGWTGQVFSLWDQNSNYEGKLDTPFRLRNNPLTRVFYMIGEPATSERVIEMKRCLTYNVVKAGRLRPAAFERRKALCLGKTGLRNAQIHFPQGERF